MADVIVDIVVEDGPDGQSVVLKANGHEIERAGPMPEAFARPLAESLVERAHALKAQYERAALTSTDDGGK